MKPWKQIDRGPIPGGDAEMVLVRRGDEWVIRVGREVLMGTRMHGSERALADLAYDRLGERPGARVLVGGLGVGFTAAAALQRCPTGGEVVVAELVPKVVEWNRGPLGDAAGRPLEDPRVAIHVGDVAELVRSAGAGWDAILLDVDNGPTALSQSANQWLYTDPGLAALRWALRPGGVVGVWSADGDAAFTRRMESADFMVETHRVRGRRGGKGPRHVIWVGLRRP